MIPAVPTEDELRAVLAACPDTLEGPANFFWPSRFEGGSVAWENRIKIVVAWCESLTGWVVSVVSVRTQAGLSDRVGVPSAGVSAGTSPATADTTVSLSDQAWVTAESTQALS